SVGIAEAPIGDNGVVAFALQLLNGVARRGGGSDVVAGCLKDGTLQRDHMRLIIHAQNLRHGWVLRAGVAGQRLWASIILESVAAKVKPATLFWSAYGKGQRSS